MLLPYARLPGVVHPVHVGKIFGVPAARAREVPKEIRAHDVPSGRGRRFPVALEHVSAADDHFVEVRDFESRVIEARTFALLQDEERVMVERAGAAHEIAETRDAIRQPELQAIEIKRGGLVEPGSGDEEDDVSDPSGSN